jgi:hypothetical protein
LTVSENYGRTPYSKEIKQGENMQLTRISPKYQITIPKDQSWFWSQEWQEKERAADEAIIKGELSESFSESDDLVRHLRKRR